MNVAKFIGTVLACALGFLLASPAGAVTINLIEDSSETAAFLNPTPANANGPFAFITDCLGLCTSQGVIFSIQQILLPGTYTFGAAGSSDFDRFSISYAAPGSLLPIISNFQSDVGDLDRNETAPEVETLLGFNGRNENQNRTDFTFTPPGLATPTFPSVPLSFSIASPPEVLSAPEPEVYAMLLAGLGCLIFWSQRKRGIATEK